MKNQIVDLCGCAHRHSRTLASQELQPPPCSDYFGIVEYDPAVPGSFIAKMSDSQAKWFAKKGQKEFPGLCLSLEKAHYLIVWAVATEFKTTQQTVHRTAEVSTSTVGQQDGSFQVSDTYGKPRAGNLQRDVFGQFHEHRSPTIKPCRYHRSRSLLHLRGQGAEEHDMGRH